MPLTGISIYKFLPKTNCKKCGFPTCLAFAMKVAQKAIDVTSCPDLSAEAKQALETAGRPPIRLVTIGTDQKRIEVGNEVVMFRHEKTFYHPPGLVVRLPDTLPPEALSQKVKEITGYKVERVGRELTLHGLAVANQTQEAGPFAQATGQVCSLSEGPLILLSTNPQNMAAALEKAGPRRPLIYAATKENWLEMAELARKHQCPLAVAHGDGLGELASLVEQITGKGVEDIVLDPGTRDFGPSLASLTQLRRLALKKNFRSLGYPIITFPGEGAQNPEEEALLAAQHIVKYAGLIVLDHFSPELAYPLLTLSLNIYTDPQKPIQVQPGLYPIGSPKETSPVCVTTNFSLTYFAVAGELEGSGSPSWLLVCDTEGLSVLTSWAAGKFDGAKIAKMTKEFKVAEATNHQSLILPGHVAVLRGELEEELPGWQILVGPREAVDLGSFLKQQWKK